MNNEENDIQAVPLTYTQGYLTLPFDQKQFEQFVIGLLGRPQTIRRFVSGPFDLNLQDIQNIHYVIDQRIKQQNQATQIQLQAKIFFNDNSSVLLNSYSDLLSYNEIRPLISIAIQLTWSYLIKFNDKSAPEKQEIEIFVKTSYRDEVIFSSLGMGEEYETENFELEDGYSNNPHFELGINYTARTWGVDMEALLSNRLESLRVLDNKPREWVRKYARSIGTCCGWIAFFLPLPHLFSKVSEYRETLIKNRQRELAQVIGEQTDIREKLDYVLNYVINGNYLRDEPSLVAVHQYASLFAVTFISSWIVGRLVVSIANDERSSFLVLTSKSAQYRERNLRKKRQNSNLFIISLLVSLLINIISSYIYSYLTK